MARPRPAEYSSRPPDGATVLPARGSTEGQSVAGCRSSASQLRSSSSSQPSPAGQASGQCPAQRLPSSPAIHLAVVARQQDRGHGLAVVLLRPRVSRVLQQAGGERIGPGRCLLDHAGHQPRHGIDHHQRRQLAAGQHVVADAHWAVSQGLARARRSLRSVPADQRQVLVRRQLPGQGIGQSFAGGSSRMTRAPASRRGCTAANRGSGRSTIPAPPPYG